MPHKRATILAAVTAAATASGCQGWFGVDVECELGATKCDADRVLSCEPDLKQSTQKGAPTLVWKESRKCVDDAQLGAFTCGMVAGKPSCVPERENTADASAPIDARRWMRVEVTAIDGSYALGAVRTQELRATPPDRGWGMVAAVAYRGTQIVDATLVPFAAGETEAAVWLRDDDADRVELVSSNGTTVSTVSRTRRKDKDDAELSVVAQALAPTVFNDVQIGVRGGDKVLPEMVEIIRSALARAPEELLLAIPRIDLALDAQSALQLRAEARAAQAAANAIKATDASVPPGDAQTDAGLPSAGQGLGDPFAGFGQRKRAIRVPILKNTIVVDFSAEALAEYRQSTLALSRDLIRAASDTYLYYTEVVELHDTPIGAFVQLPEDFPKDIEPYLRDQYAALLNSGESLTSAWEMLHGVAVKAGLAQAYQTDLGATPRSEQQARQSGFASAEGSIDVAHDVGTYLAFAHVPELWPNSPCQELQDNGLNDLSPALLVHASKLLALHGLGLLDAEHLHACAGDLRLRSGTSGLVLHKPDGERVEFNDTLEAIRQPYFGQEVQLAWKAERSYMSLSLGVGYRGVMPAVMRLSAISGHEGKDGRKEEDHGAVFAFTNPDGYQSAVAKGGLVVVKSISPEALEAFALMVMVDRPVAGTTVFPLISAQVFAGDCDESDPKCPRLVWGDAP